MMRNLGNRVETLFPVEDTGIKRRIIGTILPTHLSDNVQCSELTPDGEYVRLVAVEGEAMLDSQGWMAFSKNENLTNN